MSCIVWGATSASKSGPVADIAIFMVFFYSSSSSFVLAAICFNCTFIVSTCLSGNLASDIESGQDDEKLEEKIELLKAFLESADFKKLHSQSETHPVQGKKVKFVIRWKKGKLNYEMVVTEG